MCIWRVIGVALALLLAGSAAAQEGDKTISKTNLVLGTATQGGGFPLYGNAFAEVMMQADPTLSIRTQNTMGSSENMPMMEKGQLDLGLVAGESFYQALQGIGRPPLKLKVLTAIYGSAGMFAVRGDSPYHSIQDLIGKRVAFGAKGSGIPILARYMLDGIGLKQDEDFKSFLLDHAKEGPEMVLDGRADAIWGAGVGYPGFFDLAKGPSGVRFIAPTADEIAKMRAKHALLKPMTIPAGSYPGQTEPINSLGSWSFILTRLDLPDDVAYRLAKTLHGAESAFCRKLKQACETTAENTVAAVPDIALIHPGVMKYYREIGVAK
jgi:TRAP transporter TAXI family solute receptor